jgi:hypothetical protein
VETFVLFSEADKRDSAKSVHHKRGRGVAGRLGGPPGVKTIRLGLQNFYTLFDYRDMFSFEGQV